MSDASVTVCELMNDDPSLNPMAPRPFFAFVPANPHLRANGATEEQALEALKEVMTSTVRGAKKAKIVELRFDELVVKEIMDG